MRQNGRRRSERNSGDTGKYLRSLINHSYILDISSFSGIVLNLIILINELTAHEIPEAL